MAWDFDTRLAIKPGRMQTSEVLGRAVRTAVTTEDGRLANRVRALLEAAASTGVSELSFSMEEDRSLLIGLRRGEAVAGLQLGHHDHVHINVRFPVEKT